MFEIISCGVILLASGYIGLHFKKHYKSRHFLLIEFYKLAEYIRLEINFKKTAITDILKNFTTENPEIRRIINDIISARQNGKTTEDALKSNLLKDEKKLLIEFFDKLGSKDIESEISDIDLLIGKLKTLTAVTEKDIKHKGDLYFKLSILIGLMVCVIFI